MTNTVIDQLANAAIETEAELLPIDVPPAVPTRQDVIRAICRKAGVGRQRAGEFLDFIAEAVDPAIKKGHHQVRVPRSALGPTGMHHLMDVIMPDDTVAKPGSVGAMIEAHLGTDAAVVQITHTKSTLYNEGDNCVVQVDVISVVMN